MAKIINFDESLADKLLPSVTAQCNEIIRLVQCGLLDPEEVGRGLQRIIEGNMPRSVSKSTLWRPVSEYTDKFIEWNRHFEWGLSGEQLDAIMTLPDHAGSLQPTSVSLTFGQGLRFDRQVVQQVIAYEMAKLGKPYVDYLEERAIAYYAGSKPTEGKGARLSVDLLDVGKHWDLESGVAPEKVRAQYRGQRLPGLEVDWLVALNAEMLNTTSSSYDVPPCLIAAGLVVESVSVPFFCQAYYGEAYVDGRWDGYGWGGGSVVAFREC